MLVALSVAHHRRLHDRCWFARRGAATRAVSACEVVDGRLTPVQLRESICNGCARRAGSSGPSEATAHHHALVVFRSRTARGTACLAHAWLVYGKDKGRLGWSAVGSHARVAAGQLRREGFPGSRRIKAATQEVHAAFRSNRISDGLKNLHHVRVRDDPLVNVNSYKHSRVSLYLDLG